MQDQGLATLVGVKTFGKGIIQNVIPLENWGYEGAIKLTIGYYNPPISENYDGIGIKPDVEVPLGTGDDRVILELLKESEDAQLQAAISDLNNK
jgi:carboxyl-terminal processing protease